VLDPLGAGEAEVKESLEEKNAKYKEAADKHRRQKIFQEVKIREKIALLSKGSVQIDSGVRSYLNTKTLSSLLDSTFSLNNYPLSCSHPAQKNPLHLARGGFISRDRDFPCDFLAFDPIQASAGCSSCCWLLELNALLELEEGQMEGQSHTALVCFTGVV